MVTILWACSPSRDSKSEHGDDILAKNASIERQWEDDATHSYQLSLEKAQAIDLSIEQLDSDLMIEVWTPEGESLGVFDSPTGDFGLEELCLVAQSSGTYRLELRPFLAPTRGGYRFTVGLPQPATNVETDCAEGDALFAAAQDLPLKPRSARKLAALYDQATKLWHRPQHARRRGLALREAARAHGRLGDLDAQHQRLQDASTIARQRGDHRELLVIANLLSSVERRQGRPWRAQELSQEALQLAINLDVQAARATALQNLGVLARNRGQIHLAIDRYHEALALWQSNDNPANMAVVLLNLGVAYTHIGRHDDATDFFHRAMASTQDSEILASIHSAWGWMRYQAHDVYQAIDSYDRALEIATSPRAKAEALDRLGTAWRSLRQYEKARTAYEEARRHLETMGDQLGLVHSDLNIAQIWLAQGELEVAEATFRNSNQAMLRFGDLDGQARAQAGLAQIARLRGEPEVALENIEEAVELVWLQASFIAASGHGEPRHLDDQRYIETYLEILFELHQKHPEDGYDQRAFVVSEQARESHLLSWLYRSQLEPRTLRTAHPSNTINQLLDQIHRLDQRLQESGEQSMSSPDNLDVLSRRRRSLQRRIRNLRAEQHLTGQTLSPHISGLDSLLEAQQLLDDETIVLSYVLGENRSLLFVIEAHDLSLVSLPSRSVIEPLITRASVALRESRHRRNRRQSWLAARAAAAVLIDPVAATLHNKRLVIIADGALHYLPFGALPLAQAEEVGVWKNLLIDHHEVVNVPSLSVLAKLREREQDRLSRHHQGAQGKILAVLADPRYRRRVDGVGSSPAAMPSNDWAPLPHSRREAEAILALVSEEQTLELLGTQASRQVVLSGALAGYQAVHFATHARLDEDFPQSSGIALSMFDEHEQPLDGFLRLHEIFELTLPTELVVLSGCRTALGKPVQGNGMLGLGRGFFTAGTSRLIASLWDVTDTSTASLMELFYLGYLEDGLPAASALRQAQLAIRAQSRWHSPSYWAAFVYQGEWWPPPGPTSTSVAYP